jgi:hypothetical protein
MRRKNTKFIDPRYFMDEKTEKPKVRTPATINEFFDKIDWSDPTPEEAAAAAKISSWATTANTDSALLEPDVAAAKKDCETKYFKTLKGDAFLRAYEKCMVDHLGRPGPGPAEEPEAQPE